MQMSWLLIALLPLPNNVRRDCYLFDSFFEQAHRTFGKQWNESSQTA